MQVVVNHLGGVQFEIKSREHTIISDQPESNGGFNEGATPPELLLASLASCAAYYAVEYLRKAGLSTEGLQVKASAEKAKNPPRLDDFRIEIEAGVDLGSEHQTGLQEVVNRCLIHNTLLNSPKMTTTVTAGTTVSRL